MNLKGKLFSVQYGIGLSGRTTYIMANDEQEALEKVKKTFNFSIKGDQKLTICRMEKLQKRLEAMKSNNHIKINP